jgi:Uncharacterized protein conserved in bacteria
MDLPWGMFGENFTTEGLLENAVYIGDRFRIGETEVMVTEPRMPCYKLGIKFGRADIIKRFLASRRTGFYVAVTREGMVGAGDAVELVGHDNKTSALPTSRVFMLLIRTMSNRCGKLLKSRPYRKVGKVIFDISSRSKPSSNPDPAPLISGL